MQKFKFLSLFTALIFTMSLQANEVTKWTSLTLQAIRINKTPPPVSSRNLAIIQVGMFDSINSITKKFQPYSMMVESKPDLYVDVAIAQSARDLLTRLYPSNTPYWDEQLSKTLLSFPDGALKEDAKLLGSTIAENCWDLRRNDLKSAFTYADLVAEIGGWVPTPPVYAPPLLPNWGKTKPFGILRGDQFRGDGPPALYSDEWARDFNEVVEYGSKQSTKRTPAQTEIAKFWSDGAGTVTPPGHWNKVVFDLVKRKNLSTLETSRLLTLLNVAMADAGIVAWDMKFTFSNWRPVTAIREAHTDGNDQTQPVSNWESLLVTPPFPDYVSGHSTFSGAAAKVLELYFGTDKAEFSVDSEDLPGVIHSFSRFSEAASESGRSRIYGGIHYEFANRDGQKAGRKVAEYVFQNILIKR